MKTWLILIALWALALLATILLANYLDRPGGGHDTALQALEIWGTI